MHRRETAVLEAGLYSLFRLPPRGQVVAGILLFAGGLVLGFTQWGPSWVLTVTFLGVAGGIALFVSGLRALAKAKAAAEQWARLEREEPRIVAGLVEAQARGKRARPWLQQQGFTDVEVRTYLLKQARQQGAAP